jgi:hypothetical protein
LRYHRQVPEKEAKFYEISMRTLDRSGGWRWGQLILVGVLVLAGIVALTGGTAAA